MRDNFRECLLAAGAAMAAGAPAGAQQQLWIRTFGTAQHDMAHAVAADGAGGAFIAGETWGSLGGTGLGSGDNWLARYDNAGTRTWIVQFGTPQFEIARALTPDGNGGVYAAGETQGVLFGSLTGGDDVWLARYDAAGNQTWGRQWGSNTLDIPTALCPAGADGVYVGGYTEGSLGGSSAGLTDVWLARYGSAGTQLWIRQFGTYTNDYVGGLAFDSSGGVYVGGSTRGSLGGPNAAGQQGYFDAWLARYDGTGNRVWIRQLGTSHHDTCQALAPDGAGGVFLGGSTQGDLFGPLAGSLYEDAWLARYDAAGSRAWGRQWGTSTWEGLLALAGDGAGGVYTGGVTGSTATLTRRNGDGNQLWSTLFGANNSAEALAGDGAGGVFVAGTGNVSGAVPSEAFLARYRLPCYSDCNADGQLTVSDFGCFQSFFVLATTYGDCNQDGQWTVADFGCFQTKFVAGCP